MPREFQFLPVVTVTVDDDGRATMEIDWSDSVQGEFLPDVAGPATDHVPNAATDVVCNLLGHRNLPGQDEPLFMGYVDLPVAAPDAAS